MSTLYKQLPDGRYVAYERSRGYHVLDAADVPPLVPVRLSWSEVDHPRGQPGNAGQFAARGESHARRYNRDIDAIHRAARGGGESADDSATDEMKSASRRLKANAMHHWKAVQEEVSAAADTPDAAAAVIARFAPRVQAAWESLSDAVAERQSHPWSDAKRGERDAGREAVVAAVAELHRVIDQATTFARDWGTNIARNQSMWEAAKVAVDLSAGKKVKPDRVAAVQEKSRWATLQQGDDGGWEIRTPSTDADATHFRVAAGGGLQLTDDATKKPISPDEIERRKAAGGSPPPTVRMSFAWDESLHPRDHGRFAAKGAAGVLAEYHAATGRGKFALECALANAGMIDPDDPGREPQPAPPRELAESLVGAWLQLHRLGNRPEEMAPVEAALRHAGADRVGEPGAVESFTGTRHDPGKAAILTGTPVRVVRPGWQMAGPGGGVYRLVPALVEPTGSPVRLAMPTDSGKMRLRDLILLAMIHAQEKAHAAGDPGSATPLLKKLAAMLDDPAAAKKLLRLSWSAQYTKTQHLKAVGADVHAGRVLYGKQAEAALRNQERGGNPNAKQAGKVEHEHDYGKKVKAASAKAKEVLGKVATGEVTHADLAELATHLEFLPRDRLANAKQLLELRVGGRSRADRVKGLSEALQARAFELATGEKAGGGAEKPAESPALTGHHPSGRAIAYRSHPNHRSDETTVMVDTAAIDAAYAADPNAVTRGPNGLYRNAKPGAIEAVERFVAAGKPVDAPRVHFHSGGAVNVDDGRHRLRVLADEGVDRVAVTVPRDQAEEFARRFGTGAKNPSKATAEKPAGAVDAPPPAEAAGGKAAEPAATNPADDWFGKSPPDARSEFVRGAENLADLARFRMPGVEIEHPGRNAGFAAHLNALAAIDRHVSEKYGIDTDHFEDVAYQYEAALQGLESGDTDPQDALGVAEDLKRAGGDTRGVARELLAKGHPDAAAFYQRQAHKVAEWASADLEKRATDVLGGPPSAEKHDEVAKRIEELKADPSHRLVGEPAYDEIHKLRSLQDYHEPATRGRVPKPETEADRLRAQADDLDRNANWKPNATGSVTKRKQADDLRKKAMEIEKGGGGQEAPSADDDTPVPVAPVKAKQPHEMPMSEIKSVRPDVWEKIKRRYPGKDSHSYTEYLRESHSRGLDVPLVLRAEHLPGTLTTDDREVLNSGRKTVRDVVSPHRISRAEYMSHLPNHDYKPHAAMWDKITSNPKAMEIARGMAAVGRIRDQDDAVVVGMGLPKEATPMLLAAGLQEGRHRAAVADEIDRGNRASAGAMDDYPDLKEKQGWYEDNAETYWDSKSRRAAVESALAAGKPVPPEVLKDYPDLAAKQAEPEPAPPVPEAAATPEPTATNPIHPALAGIDHAKAKADHAAVLAHEDTHLENIRKAENALFEAKDALRRAGSRQPEKRQATKAVYDAQKRYDEARQASSDYFRLPAVRKTTLLGTAADDSLPDFVRVAAANEAAGKPAADDIRGMVQAYLAEHGHDPRIADAVAVEVSQYPLRAAAKLKEVIAGEETRQKMYDERKAAREHVATLNMMPHHTAEAEREAGNLYAGNLDRFKEKWTAAAEQHRAEQARQAELKVKADEAAAAEKAHSAAADDYLTAIRAGKKPPAATPEAHREVARRVLNEPLEWRAGEELPKGETAKGIVDSMGRVSAGNRFGAMMRTITDQGWATDTRYMVKATPAMVEAAKAKGFDNLEGRQPPTKDILDRSMKSATKPAKVVANKEAGDGTPWVLVESDDGTQATLDAQYVANILSLYPKAEIKVADGANPVMFYLKGEPVGLVMPLADDKDAREDYSADPRMKLSDALEPGPYAADDVEEVGDGFRVGRGDHLARVEVIQPSKRHGWVIQHGNKERVTDREYATPGEAAKAAKEILIHAHGMDDDGRLVFKPKGEKTELAADENARVGHYAKLRDRVATVKKAKPVKKDGREILPVGDHFGVEKAVSDKGKADGWKVIHTPTGSPLQTWTTKDSAIAHALMVGDIPDADWGTFVGQGASPERTADLAKKVKATTDAYENTELPEHAKPRQKELEAALAGKKDEPAAETPADVADVTATAKRLHAAALNPDTSAAKLRSEMEKTVAGLGLEGANEVLKGLGYREPSASLKDAHARIVRHVVDRRATYDRADA